jgi:replicative DNA helicase
MEASPHSIEAEREVIGSVLNNNDSVCDIIDILKPNDFYNSVHEFLYKTILDMYSNNTPIDTVTIVNQIGINKIQAMGGITYISELASGVVRTNNIKKHAEIVKEKADRRRVIKSCSEALQEAYNIEKDVKGVIGSLEDKLLNIGSKEKDKVLTDEELMEKTLNMIQTNYELGGEIPGISTGLKNLDKAIGGLRKGDLIIVAGRPSMGRILPRVLAIA